ncbi:MAG TPA: trypsin-like peptidase domain-containing protein [Roseovarius sp.]
MDKSSIVFHLRPLMRDDSAGVDGTISRVGRIIQLLRPGIALVENALPDQPPPMLPHDLRDFAPRLAEIAAAHAAVIGRIDVRRADGGWLRVGTGWVVNPGANGGPARLLTAGHLLPYMLNSGQPAIRQLRRMPVGTGAPNALRQTRITFADQPDPGTQGIDITSVIWPHALWDVMLCELDRPLGVAAPPLEPDPAWMNDPEEPLAILGYPVEQGFVPEGIIESRGGFAAIFEGELGIRRICPGLCIGAPSDQAPAPMTHVEAEALMLRHDASTLGGNSGSPIFSLRTGRIVGVHTSGGQFVTGDDPSASQANRGVPIPQLLHEARMSEEIANTADAAARTPPVRYARGSWSAALIDPDDEAVSPFIGGDPADIPLALIAAATADHPDTRDWFYTPPMCVPRNAVLPVRDPARVIHNQRSEPACVGFALATVIDLQRRKTDPKAAAVSARMLYEMAQSQDEWIDDLPGGTSLRAAIKGFHHAGACTTDLAPWVPGQRGWKMTRRVARDARQITSGAYFRLRPSLADFQSAIQEMGAIAVSAHIHAGWVRSDGKRIHSIRYCPDRIGAHAFAVIGYDAEGFIVQNSWGAKWGGWHGHDGLAHWSYADWAENLIDAWIIRLAPSAPSGSGLAPSARASAAGSDALPAAIRDLPRAPRHVLLGHVIHAERDGIVQIGRLGLGLAALREAVAELCDPKSSLRCPHLAILHHDPFLGAEALSRIAAHLTPTLLSNGIFPLHIIYGLDEITTFVARMKAEAALVNDRFGPAANGAGSYLERRAQRLCGRLLADFAAVAATAAQPGGPLWQAGAALCIEAAKGRSLSMLSFGAGAIAASAQIDEAVERGEPTITRLLQVGPAAQPSRKGNYAHQIWPLGPRRDTSDLPPYAGDWADLAERAIGGAACTVRAKADEASDTPGSLVACYTEPRLLNAIVATIKGRAPSPTMRFR